MKIRVIRAFLIKGERQEVGSVVEVGDNFGSEMVYTGRAERADKAPAARSGPMSTATASELVDGQKATKGKKHD